MSLKTGRITPREGGAGYRGDSSTFKVNLVAWLSVDDICVTRDQFKAMVEGSVLGTSQSAAAGVPIAEPVAPAAPPTHNGEGTDESSSTPPVEAEQATSSPGLAPSREPVSDEPDAEEPSEPEPAPVPELEAANDNAPLPGLQATGTE
jgi:hypothetical protein